MTHLQSQMSSLNGYIQTWQNKKRHYTQMNKKSDDSTSNSQKVDESIKVLIMSYIDAHNREDHAQAELILHKIQQIRRLCDGC